jgi:LPXTG-motif cell wall-anchored protein
MMMFSDIVYFKTSDNNTGESAQNTVLVEYDETEIISTDKKDKEQNTSMWFVLGTIALLSLIGVLSFKKRKLQASLSSFNFVAILLLIILMYVYSFNMDYFETGESTLTYAALLPLALLFFNYLGLRGIRKDERLIRSMDRFR